MTTEQVMEEGAASDFTAAAEDMVMEEGASDFIAAAEDMRDIITFDDWRNDGYVNPVRNQGKANCCYAFAACGVIETLYNIIKQRKGKDRIILSPQDLFNNLATIDIEGKGKEGRTIPETLYWVRDNGCVYDVDCPYEEVHQPSEDERKVRMRIETIVVLEPSMIEEEVRVAPVTAEIHWTSDLADFKGDGIYYVPKHASWFEKVEMHGVLIVGFGELEREGKLTKYWIVKNSHGSTWGNDGYGKIDRETYDGKSLIEAAWAVRGISLEDPEGVPYQQLAEEGDD